MLNKPIFVSNLWPVSRLFPPPVCWQLVCLSRVSQLCIKLPSVLMRTRASKVSGLLRRKGSQTPKEACLPAQQIHAELSHSYLFSWFTWLPIWPSLHLGNQTLAKITDTSTASPRHRDSWAAQEASLADI